MHELGIQSTMYRKRPKKPTTNTDTSQKPNLVAGELGNIPAT
ncbi:hypothetical protein [Pediococcus pentosaceus]|nr:hypothetical protein [Pediococcus pentosaceus]